ncbi:MAG: NusG domain II-containing protein [Spirochaetaceae bacterium]|nr:NusG domain II-containing protein [Spirochaetaceae bacterium]
MKEGKVHIIDSPCKNKICINQGWSSPLVCLPNNVTITLQEPEGGYDAISQ